MRPPHVRACDASSSILDNTANAQIEHEVVSPILTAYKHNDLSALAFVPCNSQIIAQLSASDRNLLITRLDKVRTISHNFGYGVGIDMDSLLAKYVRK